MIRLFDFADVPREKAEERPPAASSYPLDRAEMGSGLSETPIDEVEPDALQRVVVITDPRSPGADRFRYLRMRLRELREKKQLKSLVITSPIPQDGKSTVSLNLATVLSEGGKRSVLLIEADLHRPNIAKTLGIPVRPGLAECLENGLDPLAALRRLKPLHWHLLPAGTPKGNPTEILQSVTTASVLETLSPHFDWIIVDTPPLAPLTDALTLATLVDACLLVVRAGHTPREAVEEALVQLGPGKVAGIIFNGADGLRRLYAKYSGYYAKR